MKHALLFHSVILIALLYCTGICPGQTGCDFRDHYGDFIKIKKVTWKSDVYLRKSLVPEAPGLCIGPLLGKGMYLDYLLTNYSSNDNYQELLKIGDSNTLQNEYIASLRNDTLFNRVMTDLVSKTLDKKPKDSINMDQMLNIAVKFFSISDITPDGYFSVRICTGINDLKKTETVRRPQLEAFCFSSIMQNIQGSEFNLYKELMDVVPELYKVNLGIDNKEKLLRAQGGLYFLMRNNSALRKMLMAEYVKSRKVLPFVVVD